MQQTQLYAEATDETLLQRTAQQDVAAYEILYDRHMQAVYSLILRIVRQPTRAEELLQETFWQVWRNATDFRSEGAAIAWILRIARNRSLDDLRRQKARPQAAQSASADDGAEQMERALAQEAAVENSVETAVTRRWNQQQVQQALDQVPADQRICLELSYFEGYSQREISEYLDLPIGTVKSRMRIGMEKLEYQLRQVGFP